MITDVDIFLEHHGIKGMHWGRRNQRTPAGKRKFRRNLVIGAAGGIAVGVVGALAVKKVLKLTGHNKVSVLLPKFASQSGNGKKIFSEFGPEVMKVRAKDLSKINKNPFDPRIRRWHGSKLPSVDRATTKKALFDTIKRLDARTKIMNDMIRP
jgi:NH3-dependent NAD+ synthetase